MLVIPGKLAVIASMMKSEMKVKVVIVMVALMTMRKQTNSFQDSPPTGADKYIRRMNKCYGRTPERTISFAVRTCPT